MRGRVHFGASGRDDFEHARDLAVESLGKLLDRGGAGLALLTLDFLLRTHRLRFPGVIAEHQGGARDVADLVLPLDTVDRAAEIAGREVLENADHRGNRIDQSHPGNCKAEPDPE